MSTPRKLGYAINQWKPNFDDFTRTDQHLRAFKVLAACGFTGIELHAGSGRWDPLGRPASIEANYGSVADFAGLLRGLGIESVSSWFFDPAAPIGEDLSHGRSILDPAHHEAIADTCRSLAGFLSSVGGDKIVVRALPSAWATGPLTDEQVTTAASGWDLVGSAVAGFGVGVTLHVDALSAASDPDVLQRLLDRTDPGLVGLTLDTAELTLAGLDPVAVHAAHRDRVDHVHLKDTVYVDETSERLEPHAERWMLAEGGHRRVERWFHECGTPGGLVDFPALLSALDESGYDGWLVFESDQSPNPARSVMLNAWYAQHLGLATKEWS